MDKRNGKLTTLSATERVGEQPIEIFSQAIDLQGHLLDVCVLSLSVGQKGSVQVVQGVVQLVLLFESGKLVRVVLLVIQRKKEIGVEGRRDLKFIKVNGSCTLRTSDMLWRRASDAVWNVRIGGLNFGEETERCE